MVSAVSQQTLIFIELFLELFRCRKSYIQKEKRKKKSNQTNYILLLLSVELY